MSVMSGDKRIWDQCPTSMLLWTASRILCGVHWDWDSEQGCYTTHQFSRDARVIDKREWPAATALSSLLRALREDERLADPVIRYLAFYITMEYVTDLWGERR